MLLTGVVGPNAKSVLDGYGIKLVENTTGTVKEVIEKYLNK